MSKKKAQKKSAEEQLKNRAIKAGLTQEQIDKFPDKESLKSYLDNLSPKTNPDAYPEKVVIEPKPAPKPKSIPNPVIIQMRREKVSDELQDVISVVRRTNIKYSTTKTKLATKIVVYDIETKKIKEAFYKIEIKE